MIPALAAANLTVRIVAALAALLLVAAAVWWVAFKPRSELADERQAHAQTRAAHAQVLADLASKTRAVAEKAAAARGTYESRNEEDRDAHDRELDAAFERGKAAAAGIGDGTVRVRTVWRDRECPAPAAGAGAAAGAGLEAVPAGRADAIGRVLGLAGQWDADYAALYQRLLAAQPLIDACYEQPAKAVP